jgi:hypothetical protein
MFVEYVRINSIDHPFFPKLHQLLSTVFPPEEVLEYALWKEPLEDPGIHVYVAVHEGEVVGATEYRYYKDMNVAMTDFTIIGRPGLGIGRFLLINREKDLRAMAEASGQELFGMFAEIYDPFRAGDHGFGGITPMNPYVRREVLSHVGYRKLDLEYVHPSWDHSGAAVTGLDLCFLTYRDDVDELSSDLIIRFLTAYYSVLPNKPAEWTKMIEKLRERPTIPLLPL